MAEVQRAEARSNISLRLEPADSEGMTDFPGKQSMDLVASKGMLMDHCLSRRRFLVAGATGIAAASLPGRIGFRRLGTLPAGERLNILFLMTDQHNARVLGCYGNEIVQTPNLDRLASEGVRFTNAYCATPFCSPTRASLITGLWPHQHGITHNVDGQATGITDKFVITENLLFDRGYRTGHRGKWHLGPYIDVRCYREDKPEGRGWGVLAETVCPVANYPAQEGEVRLFGRPVVMQDFMLEAHRIWNTYDKIPPQDISIIGRTVLPREGTYEAWYTEQVLGLMEKYRNENWMLTWSVSPPHAFWVCPDPYYSMYDPDQFTLPTNLSEMPDLYQQSVGARLAKLLGERGIREYLRCYYGQVSMVDWYIGQILEKVDELELTNRTLVIFTSDHGDMQGGHGIVDKSVPAMYEEITRVPLIYRLPGRIPAGGAAETVANSVDMMPTILDYVGVSVPEGIAGRSLRPFIEGRPADGAPAFSERTGINYNWIQRMVRRGSWKYVFNSHWPCELYNLQDDPGEVTNLYEDPAARPIRDELHRELRDWMIRTNDRGVEKMPN
ncbi:MAG: sulfatase-like hydrolase/transferase [Candidatus Zipacnadales bacterium]